MYWRANGAVIGRFVKLIIPLVDGKGILTTANDAIGIN